MRLFVLRFVLRFGLCCVVVVTAACGPIVMLPGGALSGEPTPIPASWAFTDSVDTVQLETRPTDPYSVNIWGVAMSGSMYVVAGGGAETVWAQHIADDDRVRLRVDDSIYELRATAVDDEATRDAFLLAAKKKYDFEPTEEQKSKAVLYRLGAR